ncbi:cytochrome P450 [Kribbella sp. NPDC058245]|uniref:cytochrome P450 n=1 Tax=Kribbella sp. NPDC058245 TaxID=3346399 RepID=UPI0036E63D1E
MSIRRTVTPAGDPAWLVSDYPTVKALLPDPRLGRTHPDPSIAPRYSESVVFGPPAPETPSSGADHKRMRKLLGPWFSARRLEQFRPRVEELVTAVLDDLALRDRPTDFHEVVSFPLPALVICELLGVPPEDRERFRSWSEDTADMIDPGRSVAGYAALAEYIGGLLVQRLEHPSDDLLSSLAAAHLEDPEGLSLEAAAQLGGGVLFAGHETTVTAIDTGILQFSLHPEQQQALRVDPSLVPAAVEEILRSSMPIPGNTARDDEAFGLPRWANAPIDLPDATIAAGDLVVLQLAEANDDPVVVGATNGFVSTRQPNPHVAFGHGPYFCIGAPLARLELQVLFSQLYRRFPHLSVAVPAEALKARPNQFTGGIEALPVTW